jgi:enediyne biosynthesis protein E4
MVTSALWTDVDGDGWPDLLLALEWGNVRYFHNNQGKGFEDWSRAGGLRLRRHGMVDLDRRRRLQRRRPPDYVVGNVGLNTQYRADPEHPGPPLLRRLQGGGSTQLIEAYYEGDTLYPWRSRRDLGPSIPDPQALSHGRLRRATLGEIVGEDKLAKARGSRRRSCGAASS